MVDNSSSPTCITSEPAWSQVWHLPVLLLGLGLLVVGVYVALPTPDTHKFHEALDDVDLYLQARNFEKAQAKLEGIRQYIEVAAEATAIDRARYWQCWGDLGYLQNRQNLAVDTPTVHDQNRQILEYYDNAETFVGFQLSGLSVRRYAQTLLALDREQEALALVEKRMAHEPARRRYAIIRGLIEQHLHGDGQADLESLSPLIDRFRQEIGTETDEKRKLQEEIWISSIQAELYLESGGSGRAVDYLLGRVNRLKSRADSLELAPLLVLLARSYQREGDSSSAERYYFFAQQSIETTAVLNADILVGLAQIALLRSDEAGVYTAREYFGAAVQRFPSEKVYIEALIGAADCAARLKTYPEAENHFSLAVDLLNKRTSHLDRRRKLFEDVAHFHIDHVNKEGDFDQALVLLDLLRRLHEPELSDSLLLDFAVTNENIAEDRHVRALLFDPKQVNDDSDDNLQQFHRLNRESAIYYGHAADYYLRHAHEVTLEDDLHRESLWKAAISYDKAQKWDKAIDVYGEFVKTRQSDPLLLRAKSHLGKALMACGNFEAAIAQFMELVREHPHAIETFDSLVPLAQAHIAVGQTDAAIRGLTRMVDNHPAITPESDRYREAMIQLGKLFYDQMEQDGVYAVPAIERLSEAVQRYGDRSESAMLRFMLADALRKSIVVLDGEMDSRRSHAELIALSTERNRRLEQAQQNYNQTIYELEGRNEAALSELEQLQLRNAYFYQADCAFDQQQYEEAIDLYDTAVRRWERHPASLVALVQIVNARCELGQYQEAKVANDHALWQLDRIPDEAFDDLSLPMTREHWEDWLRWSSELGLFAGKTGL